MNDLGVIYSNGLGGVQQSYSILENGQGVLQNRIKAHALWTLAAAQGDEDA